MSSQFFDSSPSQIQNAIRLAQSYLSARGITPELMDQCRIEVHGPHELADDFNTCFRRSGIVFNYFDIRGELTGYRTVRWLDDGPQRSLKLVKGEKPKPKLGTPKDLIVQAYFPLLNDWTKLKRGDRIYFHESALKAINGAKLGYYSIGLNGVWGFGAARRHGVALLDEIAELPWLELQLQPVVVFDSNYDTNTDVQLAINRLAGTLLHRFPTSLPTIHLPLPKGPNGDWGFDDACATHGEVWARQYLDGEGEPIDGNQLAAAILELNAQYVWVEKMSLVYAIESGFAFTPATFKHAQAANISVPGLTSAGNPTMIAVAEAWIKNRNRNSVRDIKYEPGQPRVVQDDDGGYFNTWSGWGCEAQEGDPRPALELIANNIKDDAERMWFCQSLAYPIQNPGAKLLTNTVLVGPPGSGKSFICELVGAIYGEENYVEIGREQMESQFTSLYATKQFININELMRSTGRDMSLSVVAKLKRLTTSPTITVNAKGRAEWVAVNHANVVITTNYYDAMLLDEDDRRSTVITWSPEVDHKNDQEYWEKLYKWRSGPGPGIFRNWLENLPMDGFDPAGWAPQSKAKDEMIKASRADWEVWLMELKASPDDILGRWGRSIFSVKELKALCQAQLELQEEPGGQNFSRTVSKKFRRANSGGGTKSTKVNIGGKPTDYFIVREGRFDEHEACLEDIRKHSERKY